MYSLRLECNPEEVDLLSAELWESGTEGIRELDYGGQTVLIAGFATNEVREDLLRRLAAYSPEWDAADSTDWLQVSRDAWPPREIGQRMFLAPPWSNEETPPGRLRVVHNPGLACGTGEHPCTQLAFEALERVVKPGVAVADIGTGSGILAIGGLRLGATLAVATDLDAAALKTARENFELNELKPQLVIGSADCLRSACFDVTVANISGTVLLNIMEELVRITKADGWVILTGFPEAELPSFVDVFGDGSVTELNEWRCVSQRQQALP